MYCLKKLRAGVALSVVGAVLFCNTITSQSAFAQQGKQFGKSRPVTVDTLPPGQLRRNIENLPTAAQERAINWLNRFDFTNLDEKQLRVDKSGGIFFEDPAISSEELANVIESPETTPTIEQISFADAFTLHSKPGASRTVHLDMDGHVVSGTAWNSGNADPLFMRPYDSDGNEASFSQAELDSIAETWKRIAEDFAPYDIDVTTEPPSSYGPNVGLILVTPKADTNGIEIFTCGCGGVAYVGVWGRSDYASYQPALVFTDGVGTGPHNISEAASHELGHNLGLSHDGFGSQGYYGGHGSGNVSWAPIMGVGYNRMVTQWSQGEYTGATQIQDDLQIMAGHLNYRSDDHEDINLAAASPLSVTGTAVVGTNPVSDPGNNSPANKGIIEDRNDIDLFSMDVGAGTIDLTITPAWIDVFAPSGKNPELRGANVDIEARLLNNSGVEIASSNPLTDTFAQITANVSAGRYILAIDGVGVGDVLGTGYNDYGSLGQYFINGSVPEDTTVTLPPPAPTGLVAALVNDDSFDLSWTDPVSTPENNEIGYRVLRQSNGGSYDLIADIAADSNSYSNNNLSAGTYSYQVEAYNSQGTSQSNTTAAQTISAPSVVFVSSELTTSGQGLIQSGSYLNTQVAAGSEVLVEQHQGGKPQNRVSALEHTYTIASVSPGALITLNVTASAPANSENDNFVFAYSINGGSYTDFGTITNGNGNQLLSADLPTGTSGSVNIRVRDTDRTPGRRNTDTVSVSYIASTSTGAPGDVPPVVMITQPADTTSFTAGATVNFEATAEDDNDGDVSASIQWSSNLDDSIGSGASISVSNLVIGSHVITATAQDSVPSSGSDSITITIDPPAGDNPPVVSITNPTPGSSFVQFSAVNFSGSAIDDVDLDISNSISWDSSINGSLGSGANISDSNLSVGTHTITASATDSATNSASDTISITITSLPNPITLQVAANKTKGKHTPVLSWGGATGANVDIYRDGSPSPYVTTANDGSSYTDVTGNKGGRTYVYQVCEEGSNTCSAEVSAVY